MPRRSDEDFARAMRPHIEIETDRLIADGTPSEHAADPARLLRAE